MTTVYFICGLVMIASIWFVFGGTSNVFTSPEKTRLNYLQERKEVVYENMRDLNFEFNAGKLSPEDYASLKGSLEEEAAGILAESARLQAAAADPAAGSKLKGGRA
jgi:hypothetical protein